MKAKLNLIYLGGRVRRFHTVNTLKEHTVGQHTYGLVNLLFLIYAPDAPSLTLVYHALLHDMPEHKLGDIPAPIKRRPEIKAAFDEMEEAIYGEAELLPPPLTAEEYRRLKLADYMDGMMSCVLEKQMGNKSEEVKKVYWNYRTYVEALEPKGRERVLYNTISELWRDAE